VIVWWRSISICWLFHPSNPPVNPFVNACQGSTCSVLSPLQLAATTEPRHRSTCLSTRCLSTFIRVVFNDRCHQPSIEPTRQPVRQRLPGRHMFCAFSLVVAARGNNIRVVFDHWCNQPSTEPTRQPVRQRPPGRHMFCAFSLVVAVRNERSIEPVLSPLQFWQQQNRGTKQRNRGTSV
jgi:hypothetical protein